MDQPNDTVRAVERALTLLELLATGTGENRLTDLAAAAALPISTVHRLMVTLEQRGFVQPDPETGRWAIGLRAFAVGAAYSHHRSFLAPAILLLRRLRDATRETANLGIVVNGEIALIAQAESREIARAVAVPGGRTPIGSSAMGKAIAATWPADAVERLIQRNGFRLMTTQSIRDAAALKAELALVRARGYAVDDEEYANGVRCVAAVVSTPLGEPSCAISVSASAERISESRIEKLGGIIIEYAELFSNSLKLSLSKSDNCKDIV